MARAMLGRRRVIILSLIVAVAVVAGGRLVLSGSGRQATDRAAAATVVARAPTPAPPPAAVPQPPLPKARPNVVEPVAGRIGGVSPPAEPAPEAGGADPTPTRPASKGRVTSRSPVATKDAVHGATALSNGIALPPLEAPEAVMAIIQAGNSIARSPYKWGGGHGRWVDTGYDCSGSVSYALAAAGLLAGPLDSGRLMRWGRPGRGKWVTIFASRGHVFMEVAGLRFDTSGARVTGSRWQNALRPGGGGFVARHPPGL